MSWLGCLEDLRREQERILEEDSCAPQSQLHSSSSDFWGTEKAARGTAPNSNRAGAGSRSHLASAGVPGGPTWPPAIIAGSDPWLREALAGGTGPLTGVELESSVLVGLASGEEEIEIGR